MLLQLLIACDWSSTPPEAPPPPPPLTVTTVDGTVQPLPDPEHVVIVEAVRSLDWCVYCVAQVRAWQLALPRVRELDARLVVLSPDAADALPGLVQRRGFASVQVAHASPEVFARLGVPPDPHQPELPQTTTLVLDPQGKELLRFGDANYRDRPDPVRALDAIASGRGLPLLEGPSVHSPDWDGAATIGLVRDDGRLVLDVVLSPGFHVYGGKETTSIPLSLRLADGTTAEVPPGERTKITGEEAWVLEGAVQVSVPAPEDAEVSGEVGWQLCNDRTCSAPRSEAFTLSPQQGRIIRPAP